jgi:hypothetical protein
VKVPPTALEAAGPPSTFRTIDDADELGSEDCF